MARHAGILIFVLTLEAAAWAEGCRIDLIADAAFERGIRARDRDGREQVIPWGSSTNPPVWEVAQHGSRSRVADPAFQRRRPYGFVFQDPFAWVEFRSKEHEADLVLGLNAHREYDGRYRAPGDPWPHLYVQQRIGGPGGHLEGAAPSVADMDRLDFAADVRLLYDRRNVTNGYSAAIHAAQFLSFLTIQNLSRLSPGYGDYFWFGVALYDDRHAVTRPHAMRDRSSPRKKGTEKLIYDVGLQPFTDRVVAEGSWVEVRGDLLPHIRAGLQKAWTQGDLAGSTNAADYRVGGAVIGWEIPGLNDAALALRGLRAVAVVAPRLPAAASPGPDVRIGTLPKTQGWTP